LGLLPARIDYNQCLSDWLGGLARQYQPAVHAGPVDKGFPQAIGVLLADLVNQQVLDMLPFQPGQIT